MEEKSVISDENTILRLLYEQYIFRDQIEIWIGQSTYKAQIVDGEDIADVDKITHGNDDSNKDAAMIQWVSQIKKSASLFLGGFHPDIDLTKIKPGMKMELKLFRGFQAMETTTPVIAVNNKEKSQIIKVGFPRKLIIMHTRNHLRINTLPDTRLRVTFDSAIFKSHNPKLSNLGESGISFYTNLPLASLVVGANVSIKLAIYDWSENHLLNGVIRHVGELSQKHPEFEDVTAMVGVEFINMNDAQKRCIAEVGYFLQRENLLKEKEELMDLHNQILLNVSV